MSETAPPAYQPPRLRPLGSVHELTQTKTLGLGDGLLWHGGTGIGIGGVINGS